MGNDDILLANGSCKKTVEVQELRKQADSGEQGFRLIKRKLPNTWILCYKNTVTFKDLNMKKVRRRG
jgi:hypothetical protein